MSLHLTKKSIFTHLSQNALPAAEGMRLNQEECLLHPHTPAGVIIPLIEEETGYDVLFTERTHHLKNHPGQISFPGGKAEENDKDLLDTALRETEEEVGISPKLFNIIGSLQPMPSIAGFLVTPFIGILTQPCILKIDTREVAATFTVPLDYLFDPINLKTQWITRNNTKHEVYVIQYENYRIWGLTAKILVELSDLVLRGK